MSTNCLEWYNAAAALETISESCELTIMVDNQALHSVYRKAAYMEENVELMLI
jgi:cell division GTPase FtsZ